MSKLLFILAGLLTGAFCAVAQINVPVASLTIRVVDESRVPIKNAQASIWAQDTVKELQRVGAVDEQGVLSAKMPAFGVLYYSAANVGFYSAWSEYHFKPKAMKGDSSTWSSLRWEPWNPTVDVVLKAKGPLIPMYAKRIRTIELPAPGRDIGYDFERGDWVAPHGTGKTSDLIFTGTGKVANGSYRLKWTFSNPGDGIRVVPPDQGARSELKSPKEAPADGYAPGLEINSEGRVSSGDGPIGERPACFVFRVRTVLDEKGKVVRAQYGKMYPEQLNVVYYLNPVPNSRSLEYDPKRNLFGKMSGEVINDY